MFAQSVSVKSKVFFYKPKKSSFTLMMSYKTVYIQSDNNIRQSFTA